MVIDDNSGLIQVYATVLAGVLIFMTVQRLFEWHERFDEKSSRLLQLRGDAMARKQGYQEQLNRLVNSRKKNLTLDPSLHNLPQMTQEFEDDKRHLEGRIDMEADTIKTIAVDLYSLTKEYKKIRAQYTKTKRAEIFLNVTMIALMVVAIMVLLVGILPQERIISIIIFSVGIGLLTVRVYLHGKEIGDNRESDSAAPKENATQPQGSTNKSSLVLVAF